MTIQLDKDMTEEEQTYWTELFSKVSEDMFENLKVIINNERFEDNPKAGYYGTIALMIPFIEKIISEYSAVVGDEEFGAYLNRLNEFRDSVRCRHRLKQESGGMIQVPKEDQKEFLRDLLNKLCAGEGENDTDQGCCSNVKKEAQERA